MGRSTDAYMRLNISLSWAIVEKLSASSELLLTPRLLDPLLSALMQGLCVTSSAVRKAGLAPSLRTQCPTICSPKKAGNACIHGKTRPARGMPPGTRSWAYTSRTPVCPPTTARRRRGASASTLNDNLVDAKGSGGMVTKLGLGVRGVPTNGGSALQEVLTLEAQGGLRGKSRSKAQARIWARRRLSGSDPGAGAPFLGEGTEVPKGGRGRRGPARIQALAMASSGAGSTDPARRDPMADPSTETWSRPLDVRGPGQAERTTEEKMVSGQLTKSCSPRGRHRCVHVFTKVCPPRVGQREAALVRGGWRRHLLHSCSNSRCGGAGPRSAVAEPEPLATTPAPRLGDVHGWVHDGHFPGQMSLPPIEQPCRPFPKDWGCGTDCTCIGPPMPAKVPQCSSAFPTWREASGSPAGTLSVTPPWRASNLPSRTRRQRPSWCTTVGSHPGRRPPC